MSMYEGCGVSMYEGCGVLDDACMGACVRIHDVWNSECVHEVMETEALLFNTCARNNKAHVIMFKLVIFATSGMIWCNAQKLLGKYR